MTRSCWLAVGAALGAAALDLVDPRRVLLLGLAVGLLAMVTRGRAPIRAALAIGVLAVGLRGLAAGPASTVAVPPSGEGPWSGTVISVGAPRDGTRPIMVVLDGSSASGVEGGAPAATVAGPIVAASVPWYPVVGPGDRLALDGTIEPPPDSPYGDYLRRTGAVGTLRATRLAVLPGAPGPGADLEAIRRAAADGLTRSMPEPEAGLAAGILIGLRDHVDRELAAAFTTAGASHVVAISGWNIAIVASCVAAFGGRLRRRRRAVLTGLAITAYVALVGPSPSVVRAAAMAGTVLLSREIGRPGSAAAALGWAATALLLVDPSYVDDAGFRLSVLATAGIIAWASTLTAWLRGPSPARIRGWVADVLGVSFAAQAATLPVILLDFGRLSLVAPAVNLVVVPLVPPAMAAGLVALLAGAAVAAGLPDALATLAGFPAWLVYAAIVETVRIGASLPLASITLAPPWDVVAAVVAAFAVLASARWGRRLGGALSRRRQPLSAVRRRRATRGPTRSAAPAAGRSSAPAVRGRRLIVLALATAIAGLALVVAHRPDGTVRVDVLDVGQGDAILVEGDHGGRLLVDGGPDPARLLVALDERLPAWDRRIDVVVLTHPHEDHVGGLPLLLTRYRVGRVYEPGMIGPGPSYAAWQRELGGEASLAAVPPRGTLQTGDRLGIDDVHLQVLWPDPGRVPEHPANGGSAINNVSIVMLGTFAGQRFLLTGDMEEDVDPILIQRGLPHVDLLKVAHHGSRTASTEPFLEAVRPRVAVVSVGAGNPYGHPAPATLDRLTQTAGRTYRTDRDGTVEVRFDGTTERVTTSGPRSAATSPTRYPPAPPCEGASGDRSCAERIAPTEEAPALPALELRGIARAPLPGPRIGRLPPLPGGPPDLALYHGGHDLPSGAGDELPPVERPARLLLGRRRLRPRGCRRGVPVGCRPLSGRAAGSVAPGRGRQRAHAPPGRAPRAALDRHHVRVREPGDRGRAGLAGAPQRGP
jgi:competence protein ComEC